MKKLISIALCLAMVLTIFTINASALVETGETIVIGGSAEVVYYQQGFDGSDDANHPFTTSKNAAVSNDVLVMDSVTASGNTAVYFNSENIPDAYTYEFSICLADGTGSNINVYFNHNSETNKGDFVRLGAASFEKNTWYTYKFTITEGETATVSGQVKVGDGNWADMTVATSGTAYSSNYAACRWYTAQTSANQFEIRNSSTTAVINLDNVKFYKPAEAGVETTTPYPINVGNIKYTSTDVEVITTPGAETISADVSTFYTYDSAASTTDLVIIVDLMNSGLGMPFSVAAATKAVTGYAFSTHIASAAAIEDVWYTYKICYDASAKEATAVYRRPTSGGTWVELTTDVDYIKGANANRFSLNNASHDRVVLGYESALAATLATGGSIAGTEWKWKNLQVIDGYAFAGTKTIADGKITLNLNAGIYGAASAILAVYDGNKLANVTPVDLAATADTIEVAADYAEGNKVVLYVWDSLANAKPIMLTPYTVVE